MLTRPCLAQEIADYFVLTDPKQGNLKPVHALGLNFLSGLSVVIGVCVIMSVEVDGRAFGMLLTFGGGIYIQVALGECMARCYPMANTALLKILTITFFSLGALAIGVVLYDHEHCVPEGGGGHDHGHDHGRRLLEGMFGI